MGTKPSLALDRYVGVYSDSMYGDANVRFANGALRMAFGTSFDGELEHWNYDTFRAKWQNRALGPSLTNFGVSPVLADPKLQLMQNQTLLRENDNWQSASNASDIQATTLPPNDPKESAILIRLEPGNYTTVVTGADGGTGIALVEVFEMDRD